MKNGDLQQYEPIEGFDDVRDGFDHMRSALSSQQCQDRIVQTPAGRKELTVYWHIRGTSMVWCGFDDPDANQRRKYWNCFGIEDSLAGNAILSPDLEINPPYNGGLDLRNGGVILHRKNCDGLFLGHTGKVTIHLGQDRLTRQQFIARYESCYSRLPVVSVYRVRQRDEVGVVLIGRISDATFKDRLLGFVKDVHTIKLKCRR